MFTCEITQTLFAKKASRPKGFGFGVTEGEFTHLSGTKKTNNGKKPLLALKLCG